jgi:hypothetical protein
MQVSIDDLVVDGDQIEYHWTFTGTNRGPGGIGNAVRVKGFELWTLDEDGRIAASLGSDDAEEDAPPRNSFMRQVARCSPIGSPWILLPVAAKNALRSAGATRAGLTDASRGSWFSQRHGASPDDTTSYATTPMR